MDMSWLQLLAKKDEMGGAKGGLGGGGGASGNPMSGLFAAGAIAGGAKDTSTFGKQTAMMSQQPQIKSASEAPENNDQPPGDTDTRLKALRSLVGRDEEEAHV